MSVRVSATGDTSAEKNMKKKITVITALRHALCAYALFLPRRSSQEKSSASVSWILALLPVCAVLVEAFRQELSKLGWIEGKNITIEYRFAEESLSACLSLRRSWFVLRLI